VIFSELSFWYGLSYHEMLNMPIKVLFAYLTNLDAHRSEMSILMAEVEALPHSKKSASQRTIKRWQASIKNTFGSFETSKRSPTVHRAMLALRGISVQKPKE